MQKYDSKEPEPTAPGAQEKRCSGPCGRLLPLEAFGKDRYRADGRKSWCKACSTARNRAYRAANPEHARERDRARERRHPGDAVARQVRYLRRLRDENAEGWERWRTRHNRIMKGSRQRHKDTQVAYRSRNRERIRLICRQSRRRHPETTILAAHRRRALLKGLKGQLRQSDVLLLYDVQRGHCAYCRAHLGLRFHRDHMTAVSKGGAHAIENIALACATCNHRKNARSAGQWLALLLKERRAQVTV